MGFESVYTRRISRAAAEEATKAMWKIREATRQLLLEHHRDHVRRNGGKIDCPMCIEAAASLQHVGDVLSGDYFV